jgi:two-component system KDP operon response regulator KdpE
LYCRGRSDLTDSKPLILVVEDDKPIRNFISISLEAQGYKCIDTSNGKTAISLVSSYNPDIIVLDLGLPDIDGIDVIARARPMTKAAIIVVSARGREREKVEALDNGADDYLTKPFSVAELLARIRVAFRHSSQGSQQGITSSPIFQVGDLKIDFQKRRVFLADNEIHLTPIEYKLLTLMAKHAGRVLTHSFILNEVWGTFSGDETQSLRVFMGNIRRKIEKHPAQPRYIMTEVGVGYRLADE